LADVKVTVTILLGAASSFSAPAAALIASCLMIVAGVATKRLRWRMVECPVCHHPRGSCTCRWLWPRGAVSEGNRDHGV